MDATFLRERFCLLRLIYFGYLHFKVGNGINKPYAGRDTNAATNIRTRRSWPEWLHQMQRRTVLNKLVNEFIKCQQGVLASSPERIELLRGNIYFRAYFRNVLDAEVVSNDGVGTRPGDGVSTLKCK